MNVFFSFSALAFLLFFASIFLLPRPAAGQGATRKVTFNCTRGYWGDQSQCYPCPRGRYGMTDGLVTKLCTAACPLGKYNNVLGGISEDDCKNCPVGTYGSDPGLTTVKCSGLCPPGKYSSKIGLTSISGCTNCPNSYYSWQCNLGAQDKKMAIKGAVLPRAKQEY